MKLPSFIEDKESKPPLFELDDYLVLDFQSIDAGDAVTFSFIVQGDEGPTPYNMDFGKLMMRAGAWEVLKQKNWISPSMAVLVSLHQSRGCEVDGPGTYKLTFTYSLVKDN